MLFIALFAALLVGYLWMRSRQEKATLAPSAPPSTIEVNGDGVTLRKGGSTTSWMRWEDIRAVRSFKLDCYAYDLICVAVESRAEGAGFLVDEEHPQFKELIGAFEARLLGFDGEWFQKVAFPAFETCETVLYRAATG
jgi:hypothetical protein